MCGVLEKVMGPREVFYSYLVRDDLVKVSWKSRKCQNQVTCSYFDQLSESTQPLHPTKIAKPNLPNQISQTKLTKSHIPNYAYQIKPRKVDLWIVDWVGTVKRAKEPNPLVRCSVGKFYLGCHYFLPRSGSSLIGRDPIVLVRSNAAKLGGTPLVFAFHSSPLSSDVTIRASWWHSSLNCFRKKWGHGDWWLRFTYFRFHVPIVLVCCYIVMDDN